MSSVSTVVGAVVDASRIGWQFLRGVMGADAYERYLDHMRRTHPDGAVMTEREFWRDRQDEQDRNPSARCC